MGDFLPRAEAEGLIDSIGRDGTVAARMAEPGSALAAVAAHAGRDWFVLPNPAYGSWERGQGSRLACGLALVWPWLWTGLAWPWPAPGLALVCGLAKAWRVILDKMRSPTQRFSWVLRWRGKVSRQVN